MARSGAGALLTVQHRQAQLTLRARALRDYLRIWPLWQGDDETFDRLVAATLPLTTAHHQISAALAAAYYEAFRRAERAGGPATPRISALDAPAVAVSLHVTGRVMTRKALAAGHSPQAAMQTALVRTGGAVTRHVLAGGRDTLIASTQADPRASGVGRIVSAGACDFCRELEGAVVTDGFQAHDHCGCVAEPFYA